MNNTNIYSLLDYEPIHINKLQLLISKQDNDIDIAYESKVFHNAVTKGDIPYEGFVSVYVGCGSIVMRNEKKEEIKVCSNSHNWLEDCWFKIIVEIEEKKIKEQLKSKTKLTKPKNIIA